MDLAAFLRRINYAGPISPDESTVRALHRAFVTAVPFENLDIHLGHRIVLDEAGFFDKVVSRRRGGFCYELNGLFAAVLRQLGFNVTLLSARVFDPNGEPGREFVHLLLLVTLDRRWIADVGFGDWSPDPLCLDSAGPQLVDTTKFRITQTAAQSYQVEQHVPIDDRWKPRYCFTLTARQLSDFAPMCDDLQTAADSAFRRSRMCTRHTPDGRITLTQDKLIITSNGTRTEVALSGSHAYDNALAEHFGIVLPPHSRW